METKKISTAPCTVKQSMLLAWVSTWVSPVTAATIRARPILSSANSSERRIWSMMRSRSRWMMPSISAVAVMVTYSCVFMNRNSATRNSVAAQRLGLWPLLTLCTPALMEASTAAVLIPPKPDMNRRRGSAHCISGCTGWRKDTAAMSSVYASTARCCRLSEEYTCPSQSTLARPSATPLDAARRAGEQQHRQYHQRRGDQREHECAEEAQSTVAAAKTGANTEHDI